MPKTYYFKILNNWKIQYKYNHVSLNVKGKAHLFGNFLCVLWKCRISKRHAIIWVISIAKHLCLITINILTTIDCLNAVVINIKGIRNSCIINPPHLWDWIKKKRKSMKDYIILWLKFNILFAVIQILEHCLESLFFVWKFTMHQFP